MMQQWMDILTGIATTLGLQSPSSLDPASCGVQSPSLSVSRLLTVAGLSSTPPTLCTGGLKLPPCCISNLVMQLCLELAVLLCSSSRPWWNISCCRRVWRLGGKSNKTSREGGTWPGTAPDFPADPTPPDRCPPHLCYRPTKNTKNHPKRHGLSNHSNLRMMKDGLAAEFIRAPVCNDFFQKFDSQDSCCFWARGATALTCSGIWPSDCTRLPAHWACSWRFSKGVVGPCLASSLIR